MAGRLCYLAARPAAVKKIKKTYTSWGWWENLVSDEEVFDLLERNWPSGCDHVDQLVDIDDPFQLIKEGNRHQSWLSDSDLLNIEDTKDGWKIWFDSAQRKQMWFHDAFTVYQKTLQDALNKLTLQGFSSYKLDCDPWKIDHAYNRQWDSPVMVFNEDGLASEVDPVMDFLRLMKVGEPYIIAKYGYDFR